MRTQWSNAQEAPGAASSLQGACEESLAIIFTTFMLLCLSTPQSNTGEARLGLESSQVVPFKMATVIFSILQLDVTAYNFQSSLIFNSS